MAQENKEESRETVKRREEIRGAVKFALLDYQVHIDEKIDIDRYYIDKIVNFYMNYLKPTPQTMRSSEFRFATMILFRYEIHSIPE